MPKRFSQVFDVTTEELESTGAFDGFVDVDSGLYVDPHLLASSGAPELAGARATFEAHFRAVVASLVQSRQAGDIFWAEARRRLTFPELSKAALGLAKQDTGGNAIGPVYGRRRAHSEIC